MGMLFAGGTAEGVDALAALTAMIKLDDYGKPTSHIEISADDVDFSSKTIVFKNSTDKSGTGLRLAIGFDRVAFPYAGGQVMYGDVAFLNMYNAQNEIEFQLIHHPQSGLRIDMNNGQINVKDVFSTNLNTDYLSVKSIETYDEDGIMYFGSTGYIQLAANKYILIVNGLVVGTATSAPSGWEDLFS
jgi:hypothetical protein